VACRQFFRNIQHKTDLRTVVKGVETDWGAFCSSNGPHYGSKVERFANCADAVVAIAIRRAAAVGEPMSTTKERSSEVGSFYSQKKRSYSDSVLDDLLRPGQLSDNLLARLARHGRMRPPVNLRLWKGKEIFSWSS